MSKLSKLSSSQTGILKETLRMPKALITHQAMATKVLIITHVQRNRLYMGLHCDMQIRQCQHNFLHVGITEDKMII